MFATQEWGQEFRVSQTYVKVGQVYRPHVIPALMNER